MVFPTTVYRKIRQVSSKVLVAGTFLATGLIFLADFFFGSYFSLRLFYLPLVGFACWFLGLKFALALALGCSLLATVTAYFLPEPTWQLPAEIWNGIEWLIVLTLFSLLTALLQQTRKREKDLARIDALTGIFNREAFLERTAAELNHSRRTGRPLSIAFLDCDRFKSVNDQRGHLEGDRALRLIGRTLQTSIRSYDTAARIGGDEFCLLLPETTQETARTVIERLNHKLRVLMQKQGWDVTFSVGVVTFLSASQSVTRAIQLADEVMYSVKRKGKNAVEYRVVDDA